MKFQQVYYVIDSDHRILWIGGEWDEFALDNGGSQARANEVLSTSLFAHVAGESTQAALARMVASVRDAQRPLRMDYRCDSTQMQRRFQLTIQPMKADRVLLVHDLRDARSFPEPLPSWHADPQATAQKCSFCGAVRHAVGAGGGMGWDFAEDLGPRHPRAVAYVICPACSTGIDELLASLQTRQEPRSSATGGFGPGDDGAS